MARFSRAGFKTHTSAVKMHTLLDLRGSIPTFIAVSRAKLPDVKILDEIIPEAGSFYVMDRGYLDLGKTSPPPGVCRRETARGKGWRENRRAAARVSVFV